jgi:hypothetical protein
MKLLKLSVFVCGVTMFGIPASVQTVQATIIADFVANYTTPVPATGWAYEWNSLGTIGTPANYTTLLFDPNAFGIGNGAYDVTPGTFPSAPPASYTVLASGFMHPGNGTSQTAFEHYTIAAFTLSSSGITSIINSSIADGDAGGGDGINLFINVNGDAGTTTPFGNGFGATSFNTSLGFLNAGDTVYVAVGAKSTDSNDSTVLSFQLDQLIIPEPSTFALIGLGLFGLWAHRRRAKS